MDEYYIFRNAWYLPLAKTLSPKNYGIMISNKKHRKKKKRK